MAAKISDFVTAVRRQREDRQGADSEERQRDGDEVLAIGQLHDDPIAEADREALKTGGQS
jgi:hypothetical protein